MPQLTLLRSLLVLPAICLGATQSGCNREGAAAGPPMGGGFAAPVTTVMATSADVPVYLDEIGKATASQSVTIVPQVSGPILKRDFDDGADLKKDQVLFEIDPRPFQYQLDQANAQLAKDTATQISAEWNVKQDEAAMVTKAISEQQLHNDVGTRDSAAAAVLGDKAAIATAALNLEYCKIKSPVDGRAGLRLVDTGNVVTAAGQAPGTNLLSIQTLDPIYADFTITESELLKVQQYMSQVGQDKLAVQVQLPQDVIASKGLVPATQPTPAPGVEYTPEIQKPAAVGLPTVEQVHGSTTMPTTQMVDLNIPRIGKLIFLDNAVQDGSGTVKLRATLPNPDHHFWPGQFVNVRLVLMTQKNAVLIPNSATQISQQGPYVYVVKGDSTAAFTPVKLGQRQGDMVVVESGLSAGDQVVSTGFVMIMPGGKVMVMNPPGGPQGGPPAGAPKSASAKTGSEEGTGEGKKGGSL